MKKFFLSKENGISVKRERGQIKIRTINAGRLLKLFRKREGKIAALEKRAGGRKNLAVLCGAIACVFAALFAVNPAAKTVFNSFAQTERKLPIYCVDTPDKKISISFDAAWGADDTDELLRILKENDVKTTFFMCGY